MAPVSYTHLDVYKRQVLDFPRWSTSASLTAKSSILLPPVFAGHCPYIGHEPAIFRLQSVPLSHGYLISAIFSVYPVCYSGIVSGWCKNAKGNFAPDVVFFGLSLIHI